MTETITLSPAMQEKFAKAAEEQGIMTRRSFLSIGKTVPVALIAGLLGGMFSTGGGVNPGNFVKTFSELHQIIERPGGGIFLILKRASESQNRSRWGDSQLQFGPGDGTFDTGLSRTVLGDFPTLIVDGDLYPASDEAQRVGNDDHQWSEGWFTLLRIVGIDNSKVPSIPTPTIRFSGGKTIFQDAVEPVTDNSFNNGTTLKRWARFIGAEFRSDIIRNAGGVQIASFTFGTYRATAHLEANTDATYDLGTGTTRRFRDLAITRNLGDFTSSASDLTTTDLPANKYRLHKNTTTGVLSLYANDGGTIKKVALA